MILELTLGIPKKTASKDLTLYKYKLLKYIIQESDFFCIMCDEYCDYPNGSSYFYVLDGLIPSFKLMKNLLVFMYYLIYNQISLLL